MNLEAEGTDSPTLGRVVAVYVVAVGLAIAVLLLLERYAGIDINRSTLTVVGLYLVYAVWQKPRWAWDFTTMLAWRRLLGDRGAAVLWGTVGGLFLYLGVFTHVKIFK